MLNPSHAQSGSTALIRGAERGDYTAIREFLGDTSSLYPGIDRWWTETVLPDLRAGRRVALILEDAGILAGLFIGKPGRRAKLCALRVREKWRHRGLGKLLMAEGIQELLDQNTEEVYVTVSEAAGPGTEGFFKAAGFEMVAYARDRYIRGVDEMVYSCPAKALKSRLRRIADTRLTRTLFGAVVRPAAQDPYSRTLVFSIRPEFSDLILRGKKTVEFRRRFSRQHEGAKVVFYVTKPVSEVAFTARIDWVEQAGPNELWAAHGGQGGISREVFNAYFLGAAQGFALSLTSPRALASPLKLGHLRNMCPEFIPPQAFVVLGPESPLLPLLDAELPEGGPDHGNRHSLQERSAQ